MSDGRSRMRPVVGDPVGLAVGTRVVRDHRPPGARPRFGTVMSHDPEFSRGCFPVRFDDGIWEQCNASDVTVVTGAVVTTITTARSARKARVTG
ncbi:MAG: hypothetical protein ACRDTA_11790 [Pseudonocardiaceae bacterium]